VTKQKPAHSISARWKIKSLREDLEGLYVRADPRDIEDLELASDLARYLCIRVSGYLEQSTGVILKDFCEKNSWGAVQSFAHSWLDRSPNLSVDALVRLVGRFDAGLSRELEKFLAVNERGGRLNSLIGIRNDVSHGRNQGISRGQAWSYFETAEEIVEWLLDHFDSMNE